MRIALISTSRTGVPPPKTGSVEHIVALVAQELLRRGHEVTVIGPGDSTTRARVLSVLPTGYHHDPTIWDWHLAEFMQLGLAYEHAAEFDVISSHVYCYALPFTRLVRTPTVHTFHICPTPEFVRYCSAYPESDYVLISDFQRQFFDGVPVAAVIHNGIETSSFPFGPRAGQYFAFLGDLREDKGPLDAILLSRQTGIPLRLAGPQTEYFLQVLKPEVDGQHIQYVGELDDAGKKAFLVDALALVFLSRGLEACPLVIMEAMACGTPVLALEKGPVPELVEQEVSGIYTSSLSDLGEAAGRIAALDRSRIRQIAIERFDVSRMVEDYVRVFSGMIARAG